MVQKPLVKPFEFGEYRYYPVYVKRLKKWRFRVHSKITGRIVRWEDAYMWRLTVALNYVIHHKYTSRVIQSWDVSCDKLMDKLKDYKSDIISDVEKSVGYPKDLWWFPDEPNWGFQRVPYDPSLVGKEERRWENKIFEVEGETECEE